MGDERYPAPQRRLKEQPASSVSERNGKIWHSLGEIYGRAWIREYGAEPGKIWCQMFNSLTDHQIREGIAHCVKEFKVHPPRMGQFREAALMHSPAKVPLRDPVEDMSHYATGANKVMFAIVKEKNGVSDYVLDKLLNEKRRLVDQYEVMAADEEIKVDWKEFINVMDDRLRTVIIKAKPA